MMTRLLRSLFLRMDFLACWIVFLACSPAMTQGNDYGLSLRSIEKGDASLQRTHLTVHWDPKHTAIIVCDVWDYHHSINAVRRLDEMLPRMNALVEIMRNQGSAVIHAPSDCMESYREHPARLQAISALTSLPSSKLEIPEWAASWCSQIPSETDALYPLDQSDGGEDDDPDDHRAWAEKLRQLGRNPSMPWKSQSDTIRIRDTDYLSDKGDEVWAILKHRSIRHVVLVGVHTNMCVIGRPFGLRQMKKLGLDVTLVRDLTDCMYNPKRWPYVDHFTGNDFMVSYIEQHVCPTMTSDQLLGGEPFRFSADQRMNRDVLPKLDELTRSVRPADWRTFDSDRPTELERPQSSEEGKPSPVMLRCMIRFVGRLPDRSIQLATSSSVTNAWLNGISLERIQTRDGSTVYSLGSASLWKNDDPNTLVLKSIDQDKSGVVRSLRVNTKDGESGLRGFWQYCRGDEEALQSIPLPAKFGLSPEIYKEVR